MITMVDIIEEGHPTLRQVAEKVVFPLSEATKQKAQEMLEFLINSQDEEIAEKYQLRAGVGLAAPQINWPVQIFAVHIVAFDEEGQMSDPLLSEILINPQIMSHSIQTVALKEGEGCLSVNREVPGYVPRPRRVKIRYQNIDGETKELRLRDYEAIVVQHELDHLKGIMFYDHINETNPWQAADDLTLL